MKLQPGNFYKAVVCDLDGTLLDTLHDLALTGNRVLKKHGYPEHEIDAYRYFVGDGIKVLMERIVPEHGQTPENLASCEREFREDYGRNWKVHTRIYDGIDAMLTRIREHYSLSLAVLSNKPDMFTQICVQNFLGKWEFDVILGQVDGIAKKPNPEGALKVAEQLGVEPAQCIFLGDTSVDMKTARSAGMLPVGVLWGFRDEEELVASGAKVLLRKPGELFEILG